MNPAYRLNRIKGGFKLKKNKPRGAWQQTCEFLMAGAGEKFQRDSIWISNTLGYWLKSGPEPVFPRGECGQQASCWRRGWVDSPCRWKPGCHTGGNICSGSWLHEVPLLSHDSCCSYIQPWGRHQSWHEAAKRSQGRLRTSIKPDAGAKLDPPLLIGTQYWAERRQFVLET